LNYKENYRRFISSLKTSTASLSQLTVTQYDLTQWASLGKRSQRYNSVGRNLPHSRVTHIRL